MQRALPIALSAMIVAASGQRLAAQSPADRATVDSFRIALVADSDTTQVLRTLATTRTHVDAASKDAVVRIELGWALLRAGQLLKSADTLYVATDEFYHAIERQRHWPYPWYGLGMAKIALGLQRARVRPSVHQAAGATWIQGAGVAFAEALKADSTYRPAALALARATLENNFDPQNPEATALLAPLLDTLHGDPEPFLLLGRLERRQDSLVRAFELFEVYLRLGGDSGVGSLEAARALFALDRSGEAESLYYVGAAAARSVDARALYREDIGYIADSAEIRGFDSTNVATLAPWLRNFWTERDEIAGHRSGHRLAEHYRRWNYALEHYPTWARIQQYEFLNIFRTNTTPFDDRGLIYLRHGKPDRIASYSPAPTSEPGKADASIPPNESWLYFRPEGNLVLHFAAMATSGWKLIEDLASIAPIGAGTMQDAAELFDSRSDFGPEYQRLAALATFQVGREELKRLEGLSGADNTSTALANDVFGRYEASTQLYREHATSVASLHRATNTDSDPLRYGRDLPAVIQAYGAAAPDSGGARLLIEYALPDLHQVPLRTLPDSSVVYALRLRVQAADSAGHLALNSDSVRLIHAHRPLTKGQTLTGLALLDLPPAEYRIKVMISDTADSVGAAWAVAGVPAPALDGPTLTLSDPILGRPGSGLAWVRPDGTIPLNPLNLVSAGQPITLSYEMGGLTRGGTFRTRVTIRKFGDDTTKNLVAVEVPTVASDARMLVTREISLSGVKPGRYLLTVTVSDGSATVERTRRIVVSK